MAVGLYFDVHVDHAIAAQLRLRQVDVLTAQEDGGDQLTDDLLLERAGQLARPLVTHDMRWGAWPRIGKDRAVLSAARSSGISCRSR